MVCTVIHATAAFTAIYGTVAIYPGSEWIGEVRVRGYYGYGAKRGQRSNFVRVREHVNL